MQKKAAKKIIMKFLFDFFKIETFIKPYYQIFVFFAMEILTGQRKVKALRFVIFAFPCNFTVFPLKLFLIYCENLFVNCDFSHHCEI